MSKQQIATLPEIQGQQPKKFTFRKGDSLVDAFVLEFQGKIRAYQNMCMHDPVPLDIGTGNFWSTDGTTLHCKNHGAEFEPLNGDCTKGPCPDTRLKQLPICIEGEAIFLDR